MKYDEKEPKHVIPQSMPRLRQAGRHSMAVKRGGEDYGASVNVRKLDVTSVREKKTCENG